MPIHNDARRLAAIFLSVGMMSGTIPQGMARAGTPARGDGFLYLGSGGYAERPHAEVADLDYARDFSAEALVSIEPFQPGGRWGTFLRKGEGSVLWKTASSGFALGTYTGNESSYGKHIMAKVGDGTSQIAVHTQNTTGRGYVGTVHAVLVWEVDPGRLSFFINGDPIAVRTNTAMSAALIANNQVLSMGRGDYELRRNVRMARLWNRALSGNEVADLWRHIDATSRQDLPGDFDISDLLSEWLMRDLCAADGTPGDSHLRDTAGSNHLQLAGNAVPVRGDGPLVQVHPEPNAEPVGAAVVLRAEGGARDLSPQPVWPLHYRFQIDESVAFDSAALKDSGWISHYAEWKPVLKPDTVYYWKVAVCDSASPAAVSAYSPTRGFATRPATSWYVRPLVENNLSTDDLNNPIPDSGVYGDQDGTSYENAWNGISAIVWGEDGVSAGDTVYICGTHIYTQKKNYWAHPVTGYIVESGYSSAVPVTLRMDAPEEPGLLTGLWVNHNPAPPVWNGPDANGVYHTTDMPNAVAQQTATGLVWLAAAPSNTWEGLFGASWSDGGTVAVKTTDGGSPEGRVFSSRSLGGFRLDLGRSRFVRFDNCRFYNTGVAANRATATVSADAVSTDVVFEECDIGYVNGALVPLYQGMNDWMIRGCRIHHGGNGIYAFGPGHLYNLRIESNTIHHIGEPGGFPNGDSHAIGIQNGGGHVIQHNDIRETGGTAVEFWCSTGPMTNMTVRGNLIRHTRATASTSSSGIVISGDNILSVEGTRAGFRIYNNIVLDTTGDGGTWRGWGLASNSRDHTDFCHNTLCRTVHGIKIRTSAPAPGDPVKAGVVNNVIYNPAGQYACAEGGPEEWNLTWDFNLYAPAGDPFDGTFFVFNQDVDRDAHSMAGLDPGFAAAFPVSAEEFCPSWDSPLIDAGEAVAWREKDFFGRPIYGAPDVGAVEYIPPYRMGVDDPDIAGNARVYANGRFRYTAAPTGLTAALRIEPPGGFPTNDTREWMNLAIEAWSPDSMRWSESSSMATGVLHTLLVQPEKTYAFQVFRPDVGGIAGGTVRSDENGRLVFGFDGDYTTGLDFEVTPVAEDETLPGIYIDASWTGTENGTFAEPFAGITNGLAALAATNAVVAGPHRLVLKSGNYTSGISLDARHGGRSGATNVLETVGEVTLYEAGITLSAVTNLAIRGLTIRDTLDAGIDIRTDSSGIEISDCRLLDCGGDLSDYGAIRVRANNNASRVTIRRCVIAGSFRHGIYFDSYNGADNFIDRCVIYANNGSGVYQMIQSRVGVTDSILAGNAGYGAAEGHNQGGIEVSHCLFYANGIAEFYWYDYSVSTGAVDAECDTAAEINAHFNISYGYSVSNQNNRVGNPGFATLGEALEFTRVYTDSVALDGARDGTDIGLTNALTQVALGASTYHVDAAAGDDGSDGSASNPWATIGRAAAAAIAGDTVLVAAGNYPEAVVVTNSGSETVPVVYRAEGAVTLDGENFARPMGLQLYRVSQVEIEGFEVTGFETVLMDLFQCQEIALRELDLHRSRNAYLHGNGLRITTSQRCSLRDSAVRNNPGQNIVYAGYKRSGRFVIERCLVADGPYGVRVFYSANPVIRNSVFTNLTTRAVYLYGGDTRAYIDNCTFQDIPGSALFVAISGNNVAEMRNCVVSDAATAAYEGHPQGNIYLHTNVFWNISGVLFSDADGAGDITDIAVLNAHADHAGNILADPRFKDAAGGDFSLASDSPCIDAGAPLDDIGEWDYYGNPRRVGSAPDIGAAESQVKKGTLWIIR